MENESSSDEEGHISDFEEEEESGKQPSDKAKLLKGVVSEDLHAEVKAKAHAKRYVFARWVLGALVVAIFVGCLVAAITLIVLSPGCGDVLPWWKTTVIYQCYPRSFQDSNGDGNGDISGITIRVPYLKELGVETVWLNPIYSSPQEDGGYDITDYMDIDPMYGSLTDLKELIKELHDRDMKLIMDFVPNHTSDKHPWFNASRYGKDGPLKDWYVWADGKKDGGPPNNWVSVFGGSAWTFDEVRGQYYLHQFAKFQPDLNYRNLAVQQAIGDVLTFWLDLGVDGFRVDAVSFLLEDPDLKDEPKNPSSACDKCYDSLIHDYTKEYPGLHNITRDWRELLDCYSQPSKEKLMIAEDYNSINVVMKYYGTNGKEFDFPFNFFLLDNKEWTGTSVNAIVNKWMDNMPEGAWPNWVLGNHDNPRIASRAGVGLARMLNVLLLTLPGTPTSYYGEEILMTNVEIPPNKTRDPSGGRDGERTPMQWNVTANADFTTGTPWLPLSPNYTTYNVHSEQNDQASMLSLYKKLTDIRKEFASFGYSPVKADDSLFIFLRTNKKQNEPRYLVALNFADSEKSYNLKEAELGLKDVNIQLSSTMNDSRIGPVKDLEQLVLTPREAVVMTVYQTTAAA